MFSVQMARDPAVYFADRLNQAIAGCGTDDTDLIRVLVSRSEVSYLALQFAQIPFLFFSRSEKYLLV